MLLLEHSQGRDNNLNLIRFLAAVAVLFSHSYQLALGESALDSLARATGMTIGSAAVDVFFVTSGFLVTGSLLTRSNVVDFLISRILRIYPALIVVVVLTTAAGLLLTTTQTFAYFIDADTRRYLIRNISMIAGAHYQLPGVFEGNPFPRSVNGSLWTLPWELRMYAALALVWVGTKIFGSARRASCERAIVLIACLSLTMFSMPKLAPGLLPDSLVFGNRFVPTFFLGAAFYVLRHRIRLTRRLFGLSLLLLIVSAKLLDPSRFLFMHILLLPYIVLYLAYVPGGPLRRFNGAGDCSYGIYIYAFPVQQTVAALFPGVSVSGMNLLALPITLFLAWCSWRLVEEAALSKKEAVLKAVHRFAVRVPVGPSTARSRKASP